ncbi:proton extrusion protein PcxA [cf. Phormidesmis sp. LEGE 11477]|uniref:proton extrusion protein PcxA n=1 Tax=cf. Phormidesmis sp. LEGE 11477 TaxID=1828680 RepID=UPI00187E8BA2|nr:proton extrusion protein PcxA [cf. Phormidesmis sp. LEGE 11477]MBE9060670.1 proton extrusion protein PcxA [cf. Phormidesmis sp. LEGE 11477]
MTNSSQQLGIISRLRRWFFGTPDRSLDQAYEAALKICQIEENYFNGKPITPENGTYSASSYRILQKDRRKYLSIIRRRMAEFRTSSDALQLSSIGRRSISLPDDLPLNQISGPAVFFKKLQLVDEVLERYGQTSLLSLNQLQATAANSLSPRSANSPTNQSSSSELSDRKLKNSSKDDTQNEALSRSSSVLPRSILRTVDRIKQDLDPEAEVEVVRNFRNSKTQTTIAITFVLQLIIVPLLAQYLSKNFLVAPLVEYTRDTTQAEVFLNVAMEEEALHELQRYEERFRFEVLIGKAPSLTELEIEERVKQKAFQIEEDYRQRSADAVENVFADVIAVLSFSLLLTNCREQVATLKGFIDEIIYGLSDSAKAFIIILFTDIFVGFHSPHGWEVLLEGMADHLGLPANRNFIFLFIATFPVILDTVFKYWIFRYLNRISPSAVATYKNMNE